MTTDLIVTGTWIDLIGEDGPRWNDCPSMMSDAGRVYLADAGEVMVIVLFVMLFRIANRQYATQIVSVNWRDWVGD